MSELGKPGDDAASFGPCYTPLEALRWRGEAGIG